MKLPVFVFLCIASGAALAHGGGLNSEGCHNNRRTGDYHCHRGGGGDSGTAASARRADQEPRSQRAVPQRQPGSPACYTGPRGGTYTITPSGRKNYSGC